MIIDAHEMRARSLDLALKHYKIRDLECVLALAGVIFEFIARGTKEIDHNLLHWVPDCDHPDETPPSLVRLREVIDREE